VSGSGTNWSSPLPGVGVAVGIAVAVAVAVSVAVGVDVAVLVGVLVLVAVAVWVAVLVGVLVAVLVAVCVGVSQQHSGSTSWASAVSIFQHNTADANNPNANTASRMYVNSLVIALSVTFPPLSSARP
jgi:hypothetical protein